MVSHDIKKLITLIDGNNLVVVDKHTKVDNCYQPPLYKVKLDEINSSNK